MHAYAKIHHHITHPPGHFVIVGLKNAHFSLDELDWSVDFFNEKVKRGVYFGEMCKILVLRFVFLNPST